MRRPLSLPVLIRGRVVTILQIHGYGQQKKMLISRASQLGKRPQLRSYIRLTQRKLARAAIPSSSMMLLGSGTDATAALADEGGPP